LFECVVGIAIELLGVSEVFGQSQDALNTGRVGVLPVWPRSSRAAGIAAVRPVGDEDTERAGKPKTRK
jgi:hypothetical protein